MRIFCDTNIILEFLQKRLHANEVEKVLDYASKHKADLIISDGSFYTITYITEIHLKKTTALSASERINKLRTILKAILYDFIIAHHSNKTLLNGVNDCLFSDLEDSYQAQAAIESGCDILLTINDNHFTGLKDNPYTKVLTPIQFLEFYK